MPLPLVRRGRPLKYSRPARTVTLTLPEDVIAALTRTDADLGRAVVRLAMTRRGEAVPSAAEVASFGARAVIIVPPNRVLASLPGVELVPLADGRALIALDETTGVPELELLVRDQLEGDGVDAPSRALLSAIGIILREARQDARVTLRRILVLHADRRGQTRRRSTRRAQRGA